MPGFEGVSLYEILFFFFWSLRRGLLATRASSLAFHFFLAMIPFGLVLVILSAYLPFFNLERDVIPVFGGFIPESVFNNFVSNLDEFQNSTVNSLVSFGFILALYFSSNGFTELIQAFNSSKVGFDKRSWLSTKITSILFVFGIIGGLLALFIGVILIRKFLHFSGMNSEFIANNLDLVFSIITYVIVILVLYFAIAFIYYFGPSNRKQFKFFSAEATLSTVLIILSSQLYSFYIQQFSTYNELYGSLGTIMILLLWIYLISFVLLLGFELNASIHGVLQKKKLDSVDKLEERIQTGTSEV